MFYFFASIAPYFCALRISLTRATRERSIDRVCVDAFFFTLIAREPRAVLARAEHK